MADKWYHDWAHDVMARELKRVWYANPATTCARCGRTLSEHGPTKTGKPPSWDAGHVIDGNPAAGYQPEVASCNRAAGGRAGGLRRGKNMTSRVW